ncbi:hypothetical protein Ddye_013128 [Dipteronia dyeriana]|uniref:Uncharacterized protein n=1 Tax=Dipteronia dyeriana TaxID=168575 RepID=A0AAD9X5V3_9ROSI|nr:hypothetical protein Ddye_013128 [Dipteronia dyeriana]
MTNAKTSLWKGLLIPPTSLQLLLRMVIAVMTNAMTRVMKNVMMLILLLWPLRTSAKTNVLMLILLLQSLRTTPYGTQNKNKNIDGVTVKRLSSPTEFSSKKKKKKQTAKKRKVISSQAKVTLRKVLWQSLCSSQHGSPWIVLGDFNISRSVGESIGGCSRISGAMEEFNDCLQASELDDLRFSGYLHTLRNKRSNSCISKKLGRVLVNNDWLVKFDNSEGIFLPPSISDHCPAVVKLRLQGIKKNRPFKNFNFQTDRAYFLPLVERCGQEQVLGTMQYKLCSKLRNLKKVLKTLNNDMVEDLTIKSIEVKAALDDCQRLLD